jgi:lipid-binding SYLF domain-containing protein
LRAEILSYSRSRGLFAGAYLDGSTLRPDNDANRSLYERNLTAKEIVLEGKVAPPAAAKQMLLLLDQRSPKNLSN